MQEPHFFMLIKFIFTVVIVMIFSGIGVLIFRNLKKGLKVRKT